MFKRLRSGNAPFMMVLSSCYKNKDSIIDRKKGKPFMIFFVLLFVLIFDNLGSFQLLLYYLLLLWKIKIMIDSKNWCKMRLKQKTDCSITVLYTMHLFSTKITVFLIIHKYCLVQQAFAFLLEAKSKY